MVHRRATEGFRGISASQVCHRLKCLIEAWLFVCQFFVRFVSGEGMRGWGGKRGGGPIVMCEYGQGEMWVCAWRGGLGKGLTAAYVAPQSSLVCCTPLSTYMASRLALLAQHRYTVEIAALESEKSKLRSKVDMFQRQVRCFFCTGWSKRACGGQAWAMLFVGHMEAGGLV